MASGIAFSTSRPPSRPPTPPAGRAGGRVISRACIQIDQEPYYPAYDPTSAVRVQVKPEATEVYVDGYFAGIADDFDGLFQRLRLPPGEYEISLRLDGYRIETERLLLTRGSTFRIRHAMVPLRPGEATPPPPQPVDPIDPGTYDPALIPEPGDPRAYADLPLPSSSGDAFGALALRVQPFDAEVLIDGELWQGSEGAERLIVELGAGVHVVEIQKPGYRPYTAQIEVPSGETLPLNVSLPPMSDQGM